MWDLGARGWGRGSWVWTCEHVDGTIAGSTAQPTTKRSTSHSQSLKPAQVRAREVVMAVNIQAFFVYDQLDADEIRVE